MENLDVYADISCSLIKLAKKYGYKINQAQDTLDSFDYIKIKINDDIIILANYHHAPKEMGIVVMIDKSQENKEELLNLLSKKLMLKLIILTGLNHLYLEI